MATVLASKRVKTCLKYHGGQTYMAPVIVSLFPEALPNTYVEPYCGAVSVLLAKAPSKVEVCSDLDEEVVHFFNTLRRRPEELRQALQLTLFSEAEFKRAFEVDPTADDIERARRFFVRLRMSQGGRGKKPSDFSLSVHRVRCGMADNVSAFLNAIDTTLPQVVTRLRRVQFLCRPALAIIKKFDSKETLFYLDPTYLPETRTSPNVYKHEMTFEDHKALAKALQTIQGKVVLSGLPSPAYATWFKKWKTITLERPNAAAKGDTKRRLPQTLWLNYEPPAAGLAAVEAHIAKQSAKRESA
jgi:DNA adenine methylase